LTLHCAIQVSYRQRMSSVCVSKSMYNLNKLRPAILMFPTFIPCCFQRLCLVSVAFLLLIDPFVRFYLVFLCFPFLNNVSFSLFASSVCWLLPIYVFPWTSCAPVGTFIYSALSLIIISYAVALAHRGANPLPTPAGLKLGGWLMVAVVGVVLGRWMGW
jgi:hypothetical protein